MVLLKVSGSEPNRFPLGKDGKGVSKDGTSALERALVYARLGVFHPVDSQGSIFANIIYQLVFD